MIQELPKPTELDHPCKETCSGWQQGFEKGSQANKTTIQSAITLKESEREMIIKYMDLCGSNKTEVANLLGITIKTLYNKLHKYGMMGDK